MNCGVDVMSLIPISHKSFLISRSCRTTLRIEENITSLDGGPVAFYEREEHHNGLAVGRARTVAVDVPQEGGIVDRHAVVHEARLPPGRTELDEFPGPGIPRQSLLQLLDPQ